MIVADHRRHQPYTTERPFFTTGFRKNLSVFSYCVELSLSGNSEYRQDQNTDFYQLTQQALAVFSAGACLHEAPISVRSQRRSLCQRGMGMLPHQAKTRKRLSGQDGRFLRF